MKKIICTALICLLSSTVSANNIKFVNKDGSIESQICIAAATSNAELKFELDKVGTSKATGRFRCNDLTLAKFAKKYKALLKSDELMEPVRVYSFENKTGSFEAELCIASAESNTAFKKLVATQEDVSLEKSKKIRCNRMSISRFAHDFASPMG